MDDLAFIFVAPFLLPIFLAGSYELLIIVKYATYDPLADLLYPQSKDALGVS